MWKNNILLWFCSKKHFIYLKKSKVIYMGFVEIWILITIHFVYFLLCQTLCLQAIGSIQLLVVHAKNESRDKVSWCYLKSMCFFLTIFFNRISTNSFGPSSGSSSWGCWKQIISKWPDDQIGLHTQGERAT